MQHTPDLFNRRQFTAFLGAAAAGGAWLPGPAAAQESLDMVKVLLGVPAGSLVDQIARQVAEVLDAPFLVAYTLGSLAAALGGLDAIVFTAGIGENSALMRHRIAQRLDVATKYLTRARELSPGDPAVLDSYGWLLLKQKRTDIFEL